MLARQISKFLKGRRGILIFEESVFFLALLGVVVFALDQGNSIDSDLKPENQKNLPSDLSVLKQTEEL